MKYKLTQNGTTWTVSMIPMVTWTAPNNTTSTQQVTIKVPTGGFAVSNLTNLTAGATYAQTSRYDHPTEAPAFDYISLTLQNLGTTALTYQQGIEVPLFSFQNNGTCGGGRQCQLDADLRRPFCEAKFAVRKRRPTAHDPRLRY